MRFPCSRLSSEALWPAWSAGLCGLPQRLKIHPTEMTPTHSKSFKYLQPKHHHSQSLFLIHQHLWNWWAASLFIPCWEWCSLWMSTLHWWGLAASQVNNASNQKKERNTLFSRADLINMIQFSKSHYFRVLMSGKLIKKNPLGLFFFFLRITMTTERPPHPQIWLTICPWRGLLERIQLSG